MYSIFFLNVHMNFRKLKQADVDKMVSEGKVHREQEVQKQERSEIQKKGRFEGREDL